MSVERLESGPSIDERCARVPIALVPMRVPAAGGEPPMLDRLALAGEPVTSVIGEPVVATSDVDVTGTSIVHFGAIAETRPTGYGPIDLLIIIGTALLAGFFVFLGAMLAFESPGGSPALPAAAIAIVSMPIVGWLSYRFSRRPARGGWTCVVGREGLQIGTATSDGKIDRTVIAYDDPTDVWFEVTTVGVFAGSVASVSAAHTVSRTLSVRSREDLSITFEQLGGIARDEVRGPLRAGVSRVYAERFLVLGEAWERARAVRLTSARRALAEGRELVLPVVDGRQITIAPTAGGLALTIDRGGRTLLRGDEGALSVRLVGGIYELTAGDQRETIERYELGNPYLIDALYLGDVGPSIPERGPLPRAALVPPEAAERRRY